MAINKPMKPLKKSVCITLDENVIDEIKKLSDDAFRPFSQYINLVLIEHIKSMNNKK